MHEVSRLFLFFWVGIAPFLFHLFLCLFFYFSYTFRFLLFTVWPLFFLLALPGALAAVISMFSSKSLWKRGMGWTRASKRMRKNRSRRVGNWFLRWWATLWQLTGKPLDERAEIMQGGKCRELTESESSYYCRSAVGSQFAQWCNFRLCVNVQSFPMTKIIYQLFMYHVVYGPFLCVQKADIFS